MTKSFDNTNKKMMDNFAKPILVLLRFWKCRIIADGPLLDRSSNNTGPPDPGPDEDRNTLLYTGPPF